MWWPVGAREGSASVGVATSSQGTPSTGRPSAMSRPQRITSSGQPAVPAETALRGPLGVANRGASVVAKYAAMPGMPIR